MIGDVLGYLIEFCLWAKIFAAFGLDGVMDFVWLHDFCWLLILIIFGILYLVGMYIDDI